MTLLMSNIIIINKGSYTKIEKSTRINIVKRTMQSMLHLATKPMRIANHIPKGISRGVHYYVEDKKALTSSPTLATKNPILQKVIYYKGDPKNIYYQHPTIGRVTCDQPGCQTKICPEKPCGPVIEQAHVGHLTHSTSYGNFISGKDLKGNSNNQNFQTYEPPVKNHGHYKEDYNEEKTKKLNEDTSSIALIHIYASRNPMEE